MSELRDTDIRLAQQAARGNTDAFSALFEHYFESVYNFSLWLCNDPHFAEDLTQETFIRAHKNLHRLGPPWNVRSWLYRMARNLYVDHKRRDRDSQSLSQEAPIVSEDDNPEQAILMAELSGPVRGALTKLSPNHREALILREVERLQYDDIAAIMGISLDNVKVVLHRARASFKDAYSLRLLIEERLPDCEVLNELLDAFHDNQPLGDLDTTVLNHIKDCPTCQQRRREIAALALLLGSQPVLKPGLEVKQRVAEGLSRHGGRGGGRGGGGGDGRGGGGGDGGSWSRVAAIAALEAIIIILIWLWGAMRLPIPGSGSLPDIFGGGGSGGGGESTPSPIPASFAGATPGASPSASGACVCGDGVCNPSCENSDLCSKDCGCNMNNVCDPGEGFNCPDCAPTSVSGGGNSGGNKCTCQCVKYDPQTKKCIVGVNSCTQQSCKP